MTEAADFDSRKAALTNAAAAFKGFDASAVDIMFAARWLISGQFPGDPDPADLDTESSAAGMFGVQPVDGVAFLEHFRGLKRDGSRRGFTVELDVLDTARHFGLIDGGTAQMSTPDFDDEDD